MSAVGYLIDEPVPLSLAGAVLSLEPSIHLEVVGQVGAPSKQTPDEVLLEYAEAAGLVTVTVDKRTMPRNAYDRMAAGKRIAGLIVIPDDKMSASKVADDLLFAWAVTDQAYWIDRVLYLPF